MWDLSCRDWQDRIREGRSLVPKLPLNEKEAHFGLQFFDELKLPDVPGTPKLGHAAGQWFRDIVAASFGSWYPEENTRFIRDIFALAPKGSSKTSYGAGLMISVMLMNRRPRAEALFVGPTQAISDRAYEQSVGMIDEDPDLKRRFRPRDHIKTIEDLVTQSEMKVKTFDLNILTGSILIFVLLDELHLLGRSIHTTKVLRQIRGGLDKTPEGLLLMTTTQSDDIPMGAFRDELQHARRVRDGEFRDRVIRPLLPVMYEFPPDIAADPEKWQNPSNWPMVMPNLDRPISLATLVPDWETERGKGQHAVNIWASQHLNLQIGQGQRTDRWPGADHWEKAVDQELAEIYEQSPFDALYALLERCECAVVGVDGGGLDDLFGLTIIGREPREVEVDITVAGRAATQRFKPWLAWSHAWCHDGVLERRKSIAAVLTDFEKAGELTIVDDELTDLGSIIEIIKLVKERGLLGGVGVDPAGLGEFVEALKEPDVDVTVDNKLLIGVPQGFGMMNAIKTTERRVAKGLLRHCGGLLMPWCVSNLKIEPTATAIRATKQNAGDAKIDPVMALFDAAYVMIPNPEPEREPEYQMFVLA